MPAKRRSTGPAAATRRAQPQLSFGHKITKPTVTKDAKTLSKTLALEQPTTNEPTKTDLALDHSQDPLTTTSTTEQILGGRAQQQDVAGAVGSTGGSGWVGDEDVRARKVAQSQIKSYWADKERSRLAPRVHQQDLTLGEKILREWDMSNQYGPCIGIARLKRWKRANMLGLSPPIEVLAVLLQESNPKDAAKMERSHVDELLASRYVEA